MADQATRERPANVKEACLDEAYRILETDGIETISIREIARRLGVSHQAPYKHFDSRDHIVAALVARCYDEFARFLDARDRSPQPFADLGNLAFAYLDYAGRHPVKYRLMFGTKLPPAEAHPDMLRGALHPYEAFLDRVSRMELRDPGDGMRDTHRQDAMFLWSTLHGMASLLQADALSPLALSARDRKDAIVRLMERLSIALAPD